MTVSDLDHTLGPVPGGWEARALARSLEGARARSAAHSRRLVDAARHLALAAGDSSFTVAQVAREAGVSVKTFYRQFASKDELLLALIEDDSRQGAQRLRSAVESIDDPYERLRAYVVGLLGFLTEARDYGVMLVREHLRLAAEHPAELNQSLEPLLSLLSEELEAAAATGALRPIDRGDAVIVLNVVLAHLHALALGQLDEDPRDTATRLWRFCADALRPAAHPNQHQRQQEGTPR
jgi:AcrR family transcriptional regulator